MNTDAIDATRWLCSLLRAPEDPRAAQIVERMPAGIDSEAVRQGIGALVYQRLKTFTPPVPMNRQAIDTLRKAAFTQEAIELQLHAELTELLRDLQDAGCHVLLLKGGALAYQIYRSPGLRPRLDTDILVESTEVDQLKGVLGRRGYDIESGRGSGRTLSHQFGASKRLSAAVIHTLDIHQRLSNRELFARLFSHHELLKRSEPIPLLSPHARGLSKVDALIFSCMHRVGHLNKGENERLIWLYDIHLLLEKLDVEQVALFLRLIHEKGLVAVCKNGIEKARYCFDTGVPTEILDVMASPPTNEPSAALVGVGPIATLWCQWRAQPTLKKRLLFIRELVFPPGDYMRHKYPASQLWLPLLYLRRAYGGLRKRIGKKRKGLDA